MKPTKVRRKLDRDSMFEEFTFQTTQSITVYFLMEILTAGKATAPKNPLLNYYCKTGHY